MTNQNIWRTPDLSIRWWPVFLRNLLVWRKLAIPSLVGNIAEPLMWLVAFGYGMGALVGQVQLGGTQVPYILFLASGSICMSAMNAASFEALYSAFSRMHVQKTWDGIMNAPISLDSVVMAEMLWAAYKSLFTVTAILCVMLALGISASPKLAVAWLVLAGAGICFSCIALIFNALAKGYDFFTYYFTLFLTPMMFLSGVFFPRDQLPGVVRVISDWLPLTNAVELVRPMFMDQWPAHPVRGLLVLAETLVDKCLERFGLQGGTVLATAKGTALGGLNFRHPLYNVDAGYKRLSPVYLADYATADDGTGIVQSIEVLRLLKAVGYQPRHTIRVVLFTNEENGLRGAEAYVRDHAAELPRHAFGRQDGACARLVVNDKALPQAFREFLRHDAPQYVCWTSRWKWNDHFDSATGKLLCPDRQGTQG